MSKIPEITEEDILAWVDDDQRPFSRGELYFDQGALSELSRDEDTLYAKCRGNNHYDVWIKFNKDGIQSADCSCPYDFNCKHMVALLFQWMERPASFKDKTHTPKEEHMDANELTHSLASLLQGAQNTGSFCASGELAAVLPRIDVTSVGPLSFPVPEVQAKQLIALAARASKKEKGPNTQRVWQIPSRDIKIDIHRGRTILDSITSTTRTKLGIDAAIKAELHNMLIYEQGSLSVPLQHNDTPGTFGALLIVLPSWVGGGELLVHHAGRSEKIQMTSSEPSVLSWAAFYADCPHELKTATAGYRVALLYRLIRAGRVAAAPQLQEVPQLTTLLSEWSQRQSKLPQKLVYVLEHQYEPSSLSFATLKDQDAIASGLLQIAAKEARCALYLAMLSREASDPSDDLERSAKQQIEGWINPDDTRANLSPLSFEENEISPPGALQRGEVIVRRAALVLWPQEQSIAVLSKEGPGAVLPYLESLLREAERSKRPKETTHWRDASLLADAMLQDWPKERDWKEEREPKMLSLLLRLEDAARLKKFIQDEIVTSHYNGKVNPGIVSAAALLGLDEVFSLVERLLPLHLSTYPEHCAALIFSLSQKEARDAFRGVANTFIKGIAHSLGKWDLSEPNTWGQKISEKEIQKRATFVVHVMRALWSQRLDTHAEDAAGVFLQAPQRFPIDGVLLPAVLQLKGDLLAGAGFARLLEACKRHLQERTKQTLELPSDWRRPDTVTCRCKDCKELKAFLVDPTQREWAFKAAVARRDHILSTIQTSRCDVSTTTFKKSVPYILKCTKTIQSHSAQISQRNKDLANLALLE